MVLKLERAISKNQQMRIKYSDDPDKYGNARVRVPALERLFTQFPDWTEHIDMSGRFMESEMDLDEDLKRMQMLATAPQLYRDFVALNAVQSLVGLLGHENVGTTRERGRVDMSGSIYLGILRLS